MMKLRVLRQGSYAGLSGWAHCNHRGLDEKGAGESESGEMMMEAEVGVMRAPEPRKAGGL